MYEHVYDVCVRFHEMCGIKYGEIFQTVCRLNTAAEHADTREGVEGGFVAAATLFRARWNEGIETNPRGSVGIANMYMLRKYIYMYVYGCILLYVCGSNITHKPFGFWCDLYAFARTNRACNNANTLGCCSLSFGPLSTSSCDIIQLSETESGTRFVRFALDCIEHVVVAVVVVCVVSMYTHISSTCLAFG